MRLTAITFLRVDCSQTGGDRPPVCADPRLWLAAAMGLRTLHDISSISSESCSPVTSVWKSSSRGTGDGGRVGRLRSIVGCTQRHQGDAAAGQAHEHRGLHAKGCTGMHAQKMSSPSAEMHSPYW